MSSSFSRRTSSWEGMLISIFIDILCFRFPALFCFCGLSRRAAPPEKIAQLEPPFFRKDASAHLCMMIEPLFRRKIYDASARTGLGIGSAIYEPRDARVKDGAHAHGAGFQRHVQRAAG